MPEFDPAIGYVQRQEVDGGVMDTDHALIGLSVRLNVGRSYNVWAQCMCSPATAGLKGSSVALDAVPDVARNWWRQHVAEVRGYA